MHYVLGLNLRDFQILTRNKRKYFTKEFHIYYLLQHLSEWYLRTSQTKIMGFLLTMMVSEPILNQSLQQPCEVGLFILISQMRKLELRKTCIQPKIMSPLKRQRQVQTCACLTLQHATHVQQHSPDLAPGGGWAHRCHPVATAATNPGHPPCARHSEGHRRLSQTWYLGIRKFRGGKGARVSGTRT